MDEPTTSSRLEDADQIQVAMDTTGSSREGKLNVPNRSFSCMDSLKVLLGLNADSIDLAYLDPPRNLVEASPGLDNLLGLLTDDQGDGAFLMFLLDRFVQVERVLKPTGSTYLHCPKGDEKRFRAVMDWVFGKDRFQASIAWEHEDGTDQILVYGPPHTVPAGPWNDIAFEESESIGFDTQRPLALLDRIVRTSSNPGDMVLDPFAGSGTACVAAELLGRRWIGVDNHPSTLDIIISRLDNLNIPLTTLDVIYRFEATANR